MREQRAAPSVARHKPGIRQKKSSSATSHVVENPLVSSLPSFSIGVNVTAVIAIKFHAMTNERPIVHTKQETDETSPRRNASLIAATNKSGQPRATNKCGQRVCVCVVVVLVAC